MKCIEIPQNLCIFSGFFRPHPDLVSLAADSLRSPAVIKNGFEIFLTLKLKILNLASWKHFISVHSCASHVPRHLWNPWIRWSAASQLETAAWVSRNVVRYRGSQTWRCSAWLEKWIWNRCATSLEEKAFFWCLSDHIIFALEAPSIFKKYIIGQIYAKYMATLSNIEDSITFSAFNFQHVSSQDPPHAMNFPGTVHLPALSMAPQVLADTSKMQGKKLKEPLMRSQFVTS